MKLPTLSYDFAFGTLTALGLVTLHNIWKLCRDQSLSRIQTIANEPVAHAGDDDKITVWGDSEATEESYEKGNDDFSPFVSRVEAYLRLREQPYVKKTTSDLAENPRHKMPFANVKGTMVDDSSRIIATIQSKFSIEENLTDEQKLKGHLIRTMLFDSLYFVMAYGAFQTTCGRELVNSMLKERPIPAFIRPLVLAMFYRVEYANLYGQGYGRYPEEDIFKKGQDDIRALAAVLGENKFILGTKEPTSYDTDVYAFMWPMFTEPFVSLWEWTTELKEENANLVDYLDRMKQILYP